MDYALGNKLYETIDELMSFKKDTIKRRIGFHHGCYEFQREKEISWFQMRI
jgi:hypothetical protein